MAEHDRLSLKRALRWSRSINLPVPTLLLVLLAGLAPLKDVQATHAMGGDITYDCIGPDQYKVTLSFYRDCNGVAAPTNCNNGLSFDVSSSQCGASFSACFSLDSVDIITPICVTALDACLDNNGQYGVERYRYSAIINLAAWSGCGTDWNIEWELCCRNNAITSLQNPGNQRLYLNATLDNTLGVCNNSPDFLNDPAVFSCVGQSVAYNHGVSDVEGDSLVFSLAPARGTNGNVLNYANGYSFLQPVITSGGGNSVQIDPQTGTITFVPSIQQFAVVTVLVREFRNGVQIGTYTRDVQFAIVACNNNFPSASGVNGTGQFTYNVCAGTPFCFDVTSADADATDFVTMSWNQGIAGATFTTNGLPRPTGTFCWTPNQVGNFLFSVTVEDDACVLSGSNTYGYVINVTPPLTPSNAGPDQSVCGTSATLAAALPFGQVQGTWTVVSGSGTFTNPGSPTSQVTGLAQGANVFAWTVDYLTCGTTSDQVTVTAFNPAQAPSNAGPDQQLCLPTNSTTLAANTAVAPAVGTWSLVSGTGTIASPNSPTSTVSNLGIGTNVFRWTINNGPCGAPTTDQVSITVFNNAQPAANAGPDQQLCAPQTSATLAGNAAPAPASGQWTLVAGSGTIVNAASPSTSVTGLGIGVNTFRWTINNGPCTPASTQDDVTIVVFDPNSPVANAGPDQQLCSPPFTTTLQGSTPTFPATGTWTLVSGSGTITNPSDPGSGITGLGLGVNVFAWTVSNGPCVGGVTSDQVSITVFDQNAATANAGADQNICGSSPQATLAGNAPTAPATGSWTLVSGTGTITNPASPTTTVTGLGVGQVTLQWTIDNGPCGAPTSDQVSLFVFDPAQATANAGPDQQLCTPNTSTTLAGNAPTFPATGTWTLVSGTGTIADPGSPTSAISGLGVGNNVFRWTITNGPCANPVTFDQVTIQVFDQNVPTANAGPDQELCTPTTSTTMAGSTITAPGTGTWTLVSGQGNIQNPSSPTTAISNLGVGVNVFRWTVSNGPCAPVSQDEVSVSVFSNSVPSANAGPDQSLCTPVTSTTMAGSAITFPATGTWTLVSGTGTIASPNDPATSITGLGVGVNVFTWTVDNGPCGAPTSDQVTITVFDGSVPAADAGPDQEICVPTFPNTVTLAGSPVTFPGTGTWTLVSGTGTIVDPADPNTLVTGLTVGANVFSWTVNNGTCAAPTSDQVTILVYDQANPVANAGTDQDLCTPITSTNLQASALTFPATGQWSLISGTATIADPTDPNTQITGLVVGTVVLEWTVDNGPCANGITSDQVAINIFNGNAQQADAGPDQEICSTTSSVVLAANGAVGLATASWSVVQGSGTFADATDESTTVTGLSVGENVFRWTIDNGACGLSFDEVSIFVFDASNPVANAGADQELCAPTTSTTMTGSSVIFPATGTWTLVSGQGTITNSASPTSTITGLGIGANVFQWTVDNGPCGAPTSDQVTIFLYDNTAPAANAGADQSLCTPAGSTTLDGNAPVGAAIGTWTLVTGSGTFADANDPQTSVTGLGVGENIFRWTIDNGACGTTDDVVSVFLFDASNPVANAGPDQEICLPTTQAILNGSALIAPATGTWALISGTGFIAVPGLPTTSVTGLSLGVNVFTWTVSNGPCANGLTVDTVSIIVNDPNNPLADAGPDQAICSPLDNVTMAGSTLIPPASGIWTLVSGSGTIVDPTDPATPVTGLPVGVHVFEWTVDNGGCTNGITTDQVTIEVYDENSPDADAGPDQSLCSPDDQTVLSGNSPIFPAVGTWTLVSGSGIISDPNDPNATVSGLTIGEHVFRWTVDNGPCNNGSTTDEVSIFIYDENNPDADAGPDQELCTPVLSTVLAGSPLTFPAAGAWTLLSGTGSITAPSSPTSGVTGLAIGENVFVWTVDNGPCANGTTSDTMVVRVFNGSDAAAAAGPDQSICTPLSAVFLAGSTYTFPGTGTWSLVQGTGVLADPTDPNTEVTGLTVGENVFQWTVDAGPCANGVTTDLVSIFVHDANNPAADAGPDQELCTPAIGTDLSGSPVTFPAIGTWSVVSGTATVVSPNDPNSALIDLTVGESILVWTVDNGPCPNGITTDTIVVRLFDASAPIADAGDDQALCSPTTSTNLNGSPVVFPGIGTWTVLQGGATVDAPDQPGSSTSGLTVGANVFVWTVDNGPCANGTTSDTVTVLLYDQANAAADAGPDLEVCLSELPVQLSGSPVTFPAGGNWTILSGIGTFSDPTDPQAFLSGVPVGEVTLVWTVDNGPCPDPLSSDTVIIQVFDDNAPVADAGPDQQICTPATGTTLQGSVPVFPGFGTWSVISGSGTFSDVNDPNAFVSGLSVGQNLFQWQVYNSHCGSGVTSDIVRVFLFDLNAPPADAGPDQELCSPDDQTFLQGNVPTPPAVGVWTVVQGTANIANINNPNTPVSGLTIGETILSWSIDNGLCGASVDEVSLFVFDSAQPAADAGPGQELCTPQDSTFLAAVPPIFPAFGTWSLVQGAGQIASPNDPATEVSGLAIGNNVFQWTVYNGPCNYPDSIALVTITLFDDSTAAANAGPDLETCLPFAAVEMEAQAPQPPATGTWSFLSGTGTIADPNSPVTAVTDLQVGITTLLWTLDNGPCADNGILTDTVDVYIYDPGAPTADAGPDQSLCTPDTTTNLAGNVPSFPGEGTWTLIGGSGTIADPNDAGTFVSGLSVGENVFVWEIYNGTCGFGPPSRDTVIVTVFDDAQPIAQAGADQELCTPTTSIVLQANDALLPAVGSWSVASGSGTFADASDPNTLVDALAVGSNVFVWTIDNGACGTSTDTLVVDLFDLNAAPADAGPDQDICVPTFPNTVTMAGNVPTAPAIGTWSLVSGTGTITDPNDPATVITDLQVGVNVFAWTIVNGPCDTTTNTVTVFVYDAAQPPASAGPDQELCSPDNTVQLAGNVPTVPAEGTWTILSGTGSLSDANDPAASLSGLLPGQTVLVWSVDNGPCPNGLTSDTVVVTVFDGSLMAAAAGPDQSFCTPLEPPITMLASTVSLPAFGAWALISGTATIVSPNDPFSEITGLGLGENVFEWSVDNGVCGSTSDQVSLFVFDGSAPAADAGPDQIYCQDVTETPLDAVPATSTSVGSWSVIAGPGQISSPGDPGSLVTGLGLGQNVLLWTVFNGECGNTADTMVVELEDCLTLTIPDAFSPNGDGVNDQYVIDNLESYPRNSLQVFNRWGSKVLDRTPYRNDWDGRSEGDMNWGEELPESTYYYILDLNDGTDPYTGYIYLRR